MRTTAPSFTIRAFSKCELAMLYSPEITPRSAVNRLARWIRLNKELSQALYERGYRPKQQLFTPTQVEQIVYYLGEP